MQNNFSRNIMKVQDLRHLTPKKLWELLWKTRRDLAISRFHVKTGQDKDTAKLSKQKRIVAQILTIFQEKKSTPKELEKKD